MNSLKKNYDSLKKNSDFQQVYKKGTSFANKYLVMYVKENQLVSYVDFDFSDCLDQLIRELVIGPKCLMSERDMEYYLTTLGLPNCQVKKSQGTYR